MTELCLRMENGTMYVKGDCEEVVTAMEIGGTVQVEGSQIKGHNIKAVYEKVQTQKTKEVREPWSPPVV